MSPEKAHVIIERATLQYTKAMEGMGVPYGKQFGMFRRAIERGFARIDEYGDKIVNQDAGDPIEMVAQLQFFFSGMVQVAAAATAMLELTPGEDVVDFQTFAIDVSGTLGDPE